MRIALAIVGLVDLDDLEAALEGGVGLEVLLVLRPGGGRDGAQLAAGQGRLEQVGGVALPCLAAGADQRVGLVDEQDDRHAATPSPPAMTDLSRFSNSPFTPAPACSRPRSSVRTRDVLAAAAARRPATIRRAKPSTTAVLPTPASPVRIGLFCRRRVRMSMTWRISKSRPMTGSISPLLGPLGQVHA